MSYNEEVIDTRTIANSYDATFITDDEYYVFSDEYSSASRLKRYCERFLNSNKDCKIYAVYENPQIESTIKCTEDGEVYYDKEEGDYRERISYETLCALADAEEKDGGTSVTVGLAVSKFYSLPVSKYIYPNRVPDLFDYQAIRGHISNFLYENGCDPTKELRVYVNGLPSIIPILIEECGHKNIPLTFLHYSHKAKDFVEQVVLD